jgi:hypothetical protein
MDLSWDDNETSTPAGGDDRPSEVREPTPPPQTEVEVEATLEEATLGEGMCTAQLVDTKYSGRSHRN